MSEIEVLRTGRERDTTGPHDIRGHTHVCNLPGPFLQWLWRLRPGAVVRCRAWMASSADSATPELRLDKYIPICGREYQLREYEDKFDAPRGRRRPIWVQINR